MPRLEAQRIGDHLGTWLLGWLGAAVLGVVNGVVRGAVYEQPLGARTAHVLSTGSLLALLYAYMRSLQRRWPLRAPRDALAIGVAWSVLTVGFEFGFGRFVAHEKWSTLLAQYDLTRGNIWIFVPLWMAVGPCTIQRLLKSGNVLQPTR